MFFSSGLVSTNCSPALMHTYSPSYCEDRQLDVMKNSRFRERTVNVRGGGSVKLNKHTVAQTLDTRSYPVSASSWISPGRDLTLRARCWMRWSSTKGCPTSSAAPAPQEEDSLLLGRNGITHRPPSISTPHTSCPGRCGAAGRRNKTAV